jgi:peptide/nickel transport system substrate-binding protein
MARVSLSATAGVWHAPNLSEAKRLIAASRTRGTQITIWDVGGFQPIGNYLVSLLDRLGYRSHLKELSSNPNAALLVADSRSRAQAVLTGSNPWWPSPSQIIQANFACQAFRPDSTGNADIAEFCNHRLDQQITQALAAESNNSPNTTALWAQADRTLTDQAPIVALAVPSTIDFVSARAGNYERDFQEGLLTDQFWVR